MDQVILDLGLDANVLLKQTWEHMGHVTIVPYSIMNGKPTEDFPMGRLQGVTVDIEGESAQADFEVIEIVDDKNPYPALLGIVWATDMNGVINLKKRKMIFEKKALRVVVPLDPAKGAGYIEPVRDDDSNDDPDCIYKITT